MATLRFDHVVIVVRDIDAAIAFFTALGMELEGRAEISDESAARASALTDLQCTIAMMKTPDGSGRIELTHYTSPEVIEPQPSVAPANTLGYRSVMFEVEHIETVIDRLAPLGGELLGEIMQWEQSYRLCYLRGPEGVIVALAQSVGA